MPETESFQLIEKEPVILRPAAISEDGVDLTLIRWMLSLSPLERLQVLQQHIRSIMRLRNANLRSG